MPINEELLAEMLAQCQALAEREGLRPGNSRCVLIDHGENEPFVSRAFTSRPPTTSELTGTWAVWYPLADGDPEDGLVIVRTVRDLREDSATSEDTGGRTDDPR